MYFRGEDLEKFKGLFLAEYICKTMNNFSFQSFTYMIRQLIKLSSYGVLTFQAVSWAYLCDCSVVTIETRL